MTARIARAIYRLLVVLAAAEVGNGSINLSAKALVRQTLAGLFPDADRTSNSHMEVAGDRVLVAHEVGAGFQVAGTGFRRETIDVGRFPIGVTAVSVTNPPPAWKSWSTGRLSTPASTVRSEYPVPAAICLWATGPTRRSVRS